MSSLSESGFVAAAVASWLGLDKQLPVSASHGMLSYDATGLHDSRRGERVAKVIRNGKRIAVVYDPRGGQRYGSWGRSGDCVANMLVDAWRALNTDKRSVLIRSGRRELHRDPVEMVKRLSSANDYASALALAPFAGMKKRDVPVPTLASDSGSSYLAERVKREAASAAHYLVPELAKARRKKEREARIEAEKERARNRRLQERLAPYERAYYDAREALDRLQRGTWNAQTLLANCGLTTAPHDLMFKITNPGRFPCSGGNAGDQWPVPGEWTREENPRVCYRGWHLCTSSGITNWIKTGTTQELWIAEGDATMPADARQHDKVAYSRARLVRLIASGDLTSLGKPKPDAAAIAAAEAAVEKARGDLAFASQGY